MKIHSKFVDFYDYISHQYGADPDVVYSRGLLAPPGSQAITDGRVSLPVPPGMGAAIRLARPLGFSRYRSVGRKQVYVPERAPYETSTLVAGRYVFNVLSRRMEMDPEEVKLGLPYKPPTYQHQLVTDQLPQELKEMFKPSDAKFKAPTITPPEDTVHALIRLVGAPVFLVHGTQGSGLKERLVLDKRVPILSDYGVAALVSAQQMWQNLYHVFQNVLRKNPDKDPPCVIANDDRVEAAGFDLETSFRNPINPRPKRTHGRR